MLSIYYFKPSTMRLKTQKYWISFLVIVAIIDTTCSSENDNLPEGRRNARVSGRIVKLYSGPRPDPVICLGEGFQKDNVDCSVFYRCLKTSNGKYTVYRFQCGPGTVYDPETEVCNHPRRTKRLECGGFGGEKLISSTEKYFENEIDGSYKENQEVPSPITTKSPGDLTAVSSVFIAANSDKLVNPYVTFYPWTTTSSPAETTVSLTSSSWHKITSVSTKNPKYYTSRETTSFTTPRSNSRENQCVSDGFMGDSEDCRKFYRCVSNQRGGYLRYEFSCSESTIWDDDTQGCNHPWAVQRRRCGKDYVENGISDVNKNKNDELPPSAVQQQTQISYGSKVTQSQVQISNGTVVQNQTQIHYGDRLNYGGYKIKQNQTQIGYESAVSQSQTQISFGNKGTQTQLQVDHSNHSSQSQTQIVEYSSPSTFTATYSQFAIDSTKKCTKDGFVGDSNDCSKFYRCVSDGRGGFKRHEFSCSEGTLWDQNLEACNHAWAVKDCGAKISSQSTQTFVTVSKPTQAYYTTTTSFLNNEIDDGTGYGNQNNKDDLEHSTQKVIASSNTVSSEPLKLVESNCQSNGFFGYADDCARFYRCVENGRGGFTKYEYKCGEGTVWDSNIESCNHAWAVNQCGGSAQKQNIMSSSTENAIITTVSLIQTTTQKNIYDNYYDPGYGSIQRETSEPPVLSTERISGNTCEASGFMGDDSDCKKFYRCVENNHGQFTRHEFTCGEGTVWDPEIEACNHAWAVKRCGSSAIKDHEIPSNIISEAGSNEDNNYNVPHDTTKYTEIHTQSTTHSSTTTTVSTVPNKGQDCESSGFMGDDGDCKIFYRCVENGNGGFARYQFSCGDGTVWDPKISACNHASAVETCGGGRPEETKPSTIGTDSVSSSSEVPSESTVSTTIRTSTTPTSTAADITTQCVNNGFLGDKHDCKKFYRCVDDGKGSFIRYEFSCGEGTVWDPKIEACNHEWAVDSCGSKKPSVVVETSTTSRTTVKDNDDDNDNMTHNATTQYITTTSKPLKSQNCEQEGFMGDKNDCKKFYRCTDNGKGGFNKYEFTCGDGTVWDQEILACNHKSSDRHCSSSESETHTESNESLVNSIVTSPSKATTTFSSDSTGKTESSSNNDECTSEGFFANSNDCKKFYRCVSDGKGTFLKYDFTCGDGTVWVQDILACDHDSDNSYCGQAASTSSTTSHSSQEQLVTSSTTALPPSTTNAYLSTTDDDYTSTSSVKPFPQNDNICQSDGFYPNNQDCTKFYQCVNNGDGGYRKYEYACSEGTAWDINTQSCNYINEVKSCQNQAVSQTKPALHDESTSETSSTTKDPSVDSSTSSTTKDPSTGSSTSSSNEDSCGNEGYFGNSKDCKKFYRCVDNGKGGFSKYDYTCGEGTIWDQDIIACNHPQDVSNPSCNNASSTTTTAANSESSETTTKGASSTSEATEATTTTTTTTTTTAAAGGDIQSSQSESTKNPSNNNYTCTEAGFYPDPYDCKKFYRCVDWDGDGKSFSIFHFECGEGTIWDPVVQTCNHEESVYPPRDCSGAQSQNNNGTEETEGTTSKQEESTESSTTEGSTTKAQSTTQKSTTQDSSSTTKLSSTTEQTSTTQQSTTEQSTTHKTTTEQSTTQQSTMGQSTTQQSTTEQSTTQQSTTEQNITQQSTTEQSTTQQSTSASEQTTSEQSSTAQQTTTTEQTTSTTTEQSTTTLTEQTTTSTEDTTTTTAQSTTSESTTAEQSTTQESNTEQSSENQSSTTEHSSTTQESTEGSSTTENVQETTTEKGSSEKECPDTDDDQYLYVCPTGFKRHPKYCNLFYQCTEDDDSHEVKVAVFNCPNNTIYDESKIQCVEEEKADKKCDGQIAQKRRVKRLDTNYKEPIVVNRQKYSCPSVGHFPFEKTEECSPVLLKCEATKTGKLRGLVYQCPEGYVYWSISRRCEPLNSLPDCKRSYSEWNGRYEIPTERKNIARKK